NSLSTNFVAVEDHLSLRLVELEVGVSVNEQAAGECFLHQLVAELDQLPRFRRRSNHEFHREISAAWKRWWRQRDDSDARNLRQRPDRLNQKLLSGFLSLAPGLGYHAAETAAWRGDLKNALTFGERMVNVVNLGREQIRLIDRRIRGALNDPKHHSLIFRGRQFALRKHVERHDQRNHDRPENQNHGAVLEGPGQQARISVAHPFEMA